MSSSSQQQQRNFSILFTVVSLIFWIWAVINTVHNLSSVGTIYILPPVLITQYILLSSCQSNNNCGASYAILGTHLFVTLNYLLGIYVALGTDMIQPPERQSGFAIYCGVAAFFWFISAATSSGII